MCVILSVESDIPVPWYLCNWSV